MKKNILKLFLLSIALFFGFNTAKANYSVAFNSTTGAVNTKGLSNSPIATTATNYGVMGFTLTGSGGGGANSTLTQLVFTSANANGNSTFFNTAYIYVSPGGANYTPGTTNVAGNLISTATSDATQTITFNMNVAINGATSATYYIVFSNSNVTTAGTGNYQLTFSNYASAKNFTNGASITGPTYTFAPTVSLGTATTTGLAATGSLNSSTQTQQGILGFSVTTSVATTINTMTFTPTVSAGTMGSYFTNVKLYVNTVNTFSSATVVAGTVSALTGATITITGLTQAVNNTTNYYFIKADYLPPASGNPTFQLSATSVTTSTPTTVTIGGPIAGIVYTLYNGVTTATALGAGGANPGAGLLANPIINPEVGAIYGMSLSNSGTAASPTITALNFTATASQPNNSYYFTNFTLYSSPTNSFSAGTATQVGTVQTAGAGLNVNFTIPGVSIPAGGTLYYFVSVTYNTIAASNTYQMNFASATTASSTTSVAANAANTGFNYTVSPPAYTVTSNTSGIQTSATPYYFGSTGDVLESFGVTSTGPTSFTDFTVRTYINGSATTASYTTYFNNLTVYSSSNPNYAADLAGTGSPLTSVPFTSAGVMGVTITLNTPQALSTTPIYYFVVADFTAGDNLFTSTSAPATTFQFRLTAANASTGTLTTTLPLAYTIYNLDSPISFGTSSGTGLAGVNSLNSNIPQAAILGFSLTSVVPQTVNTISFSATIVPSTNEINAFFSTVTLYSNTTDNASTATAVSAGYTVSSLNGKTFTISGLSLNVSTTKVYYYIKADFTAPNNFSSTFQLSATSCTTTTPLTCTAGTPVDGPVYNISPAVILSNATATGLAANPITSGQNGATLTIFDFSVYTGPANTFTQFNLSTVQPAGQYPTTNFSGYALYVNKTTNSLTGATLVAGTTFNSNTTTDTLYISGLSQAIPSGSTYYYFIKAVYLSPAVATTYQLNLSSVATSTTTYATGGPINGINYTLSGPLGVYYWEGQTQNIFGTTVITNSTWEVAKNWLNANTNTVNNGYPNQSVNNDIAVFSGTYIKANVCNITSNKTISQMLVSIDQQYSMDVQIANGLTCTVNSAFTVGDPGLVNPVYATPPANGVPRSQLILDETNGTGGTGQYFINGLSSIYNDGSVAIAGPTTFSSGSVLNLYGTSNDPAFFGVFGATCTATGVIWNLKGNLSAIYVDFSAGSTLNASASTVNFTGFSAQVSSSGTTNFSGCTLNSTTISNNNYLSGVGCDEGTTTITGPSVVNLGTTSSNGNYNELQNTGGTFNVSGTTVVNMRGPSAYIYNDYTKTVNGGTARNPTYTPQAIFNVTGATINLGTTGGTNGSNTTIYNTDAAYFNLNAGGIINLNGPNASINNTNDANSLGTLGYGVFQAAPTSFINPANATSLINNDNASDYFTLLSNISASATIGTLTPGARIFGKYDVQRYLNGGSAYLRNYRLLSSPVNITSATSSQYNKLDMSYPGASATIPYIGTVYNGAFLLGPDATFGGGNHTIPNPAMYLYQENITPGGSYNTSFTSGKYVGIASIGSGTITTKSSAAGAGSGSTGSSPSVASSAISLPGYDNASGMSVPPGNAYLMFYIDNNTRTTAASAPSIPNASTVTASGYINQNQVQVFMWASLSAALTDTYGLSTVRSPGITMVGNPYPSTIDLKTVYSDNSGTITPTLYQLDKTTQQFDSYNAAINASSTSLSSEYVASGQGFYIHVDSLGTSKAFAFQEGEKTPYGSAGFYPPISQFDIPNGPANTVDNVNVSSGAGVTTDNVNLSSGNTAADNLNTAPASSQNLNNRGVISKTTGMSQISFMPHYLSTAQIGTDTAITTLDKLPTRLAGKSPTVKPLHNPSVPKEAIVPLSTKILPPVIARPAGLHLKLVVDSVTNDEVGVYFNKAWSDKFDTNDSYDLDGQGSKAFLSSYTADGIRTSINTMGDYTGGKRVKLYVKAAADGLYQLQMSDIANINTVQYSVFLIDNLKKDSLDFTLYKSYNFNYAVSDTASYKNRFVLVIEHKPVPQYALVAFAGQKVTKGVQLNWKTQNEVNTTTFVLQKLTANNTYVFLDSLTSESAGDYAYIDQHPTLGNNTYRLQQTDGLGNMTYSAPVTIGYNSTSPNGELTIYPNPSKSVITVTLSTSSIASQIATADIYNTSGTLISHRVVGSNSFNHDISNYKLGVYIIELKNSNGVLVGKSKFVKVE